MLNLLGNVFTPNGSVATGSGSGSQGANNDPAPTEEVVEIVEPVTEAAEEPIVTTENPDYAPTSSTPNSYWNSSEDEDLMSGVSAQLDTRESDEVVAVDFARRAAIAAQEKAASAALLGEISDDPFTPLGAGKEGANAAYANQNSEPQRLGDPMNVSA